MSTVILSAASSDDASLQAIAALLCAELHARAETDIRIIELAQLQLAYCQGEFDCWAKTPGVCRTHDAEQEILRAIHDADRMVLLGPVTFGGHGYTLKRALDRLICLLLPQFRARSELTHHPARYDKRASWYAVGYLPQADAEQSATYRALADANAINYLAPVVDAVVLDEAHRAAWPEAVHALFAASEKPGEQIGARSVLRDELLTAAAPTALEAPGLKPKSAAILIGSAKIKGTSASENMGRALNARLERAGVETQLCFATELLHDAQAQATASELARRELFILVTPLYVDSLPALATRALELVTKARSEVRAAAAFSMLVNCGFPEPEHNRTALRIARHFADAAGYHWAGGLPLGGGGMIDPKRPLDAQGGPAEHVKRALDLAVPALVAGQNVPSEALTLMLKAPLPDALYRLIGDLGFRYQLHLHGVRQRDLRAHPLDR
jgi:multimeric flavodoxin WrbA